MNHETETAAPALVGQVEPGVGRPVPKREKLTPLKQRIVNALLLRREVSYYTLAYELWPPATCGRAWNYSSNGGPHGWAMPLGRALRELEAAGIVLDRSPRRDGGGRSERTVRLLTPNVGAKAPT